MNNPHISVAIPEYKSDELDNLSDCIYSVLAEEYGSFDIVVISESDTVTSFVEDEFASTDIVTVEPIENTDGGVSVARNAAVTATDGEIIAYIDSDATADEGWLQTLADVYTATTKLAVGGSATPEWQTERPSILPDEFLWLVGSTYEGHPSDGSTVRATFGCNMSYRREVLETLQFDENLGKEHGYNLQGEEPELGARMITEFGEGMYYTEDASVSHRVNGDQSTIRWLSKRAYLQGISKAIIQTNTNGDVLDTETDFLKYVLLNSLPKYALTSPRKSLGTAYFTGLVGLGYLVGKTKDIIN